MSGVDYARLALEWEQRKMTELFTKKSSGWFRGCGCGERASDKVTVPEGTVELFVQASGALEGPATGFEYNFVPNTNSIDIDPSDASIWRIAGIAHDPKQGFKGRFARIGST